MLQEFESEVTAASAKHQTFDPLKPGVGILLRDVISQRLVESIAAQLELKAIILLESSLSLDVLDEFEVIIADEALARTIRALFNNRETKVEGINPALVSVTSWEEDTLSTRVVDPNFEGVLSLPQEPVQLLTQLSIILYAHRAYARRYQSTLDELHLNRRIFRSVSSGITVARADLPDFPLLYVNPAFEVMTGYSFEEVQGKNCRFLQGPEHNQPGLTLVREAIARGREVTALLKNYRKNGTSFWNELSLSPIRNADGVVTHIVGIQNDVTQRVEFEDALRESEKLAAVGRLAASISHEINNPLEAVTNLLYLARHEEEVSEIHNYLEQADSELRRASQITSQSLRFYKQSTKPQAVRPMDIVEAVLELYRGKIENAHITVESRPRMTGSIVCFESEIRQVLSNLVRNSIDSMIGKGGRLLVRSREAIEWRSDVQGMVITIADQGSGISPEAKKSLYRAFFTTKGIAGTGLGLWVSSEIVKRHNGRLLVRSSTRPGCTWTVFQLFLPYQPFAA